MKSNRETSLLESAVKTAHSKKIRRKIHDSIGLQTQLQARNPPLLRLALRSPPAIRDQEINQHQRDH